MQLICKVCGGHGRWQPEGLQWWNDFIKEHFLFCAINSLDNYTAIHMILNAINMHRAHLKVTNKQLTSEICTVVAFSNRWEVRDRTETETTIQTPLLPELVDHLREAWGIPISPLSSNNRC